MKRKFLEKAQELLIIGLFCYMAFLVFLIWRVLVSPSFDGLPITNYCFAIFGGISSISFSWARHIQDKNKYRSRRIGRIAEVSLSVAIMFVLASGLKYVWIKKGSLLSTNVAFNKWTLSVAFVASDILTSLSLLFGTIVMCTILYQILQPETKGATIE